MLAENIVADAPRVRPQLSAEGLEVLQAALEKERGSFPCSASSALKHAVWRICLDARRNNWPPEWLLVAFKTGAHSLPAVQRVARGPDRDELVAHLVSLCIEQYYALPVLGARENREQPLPR